MSDKIVDIGLVAATFANDAELQQYTNKLFAQNKIYVERVQKLEAEITHLKELLSSTTSLVEDGTSKFNVSTEQAIVESQIERIKAKAFSEELDLEDTKKLEILVKTLRIIKDNTTPKKEKLPKEISEETLFNLAAQKKELPDGES